MTKSLNSNVDGAAGFTPASSITGLAAPLRPIAVATGLGALIGTGGGIDGTLNNRGSRLGLYTRNSLGHNILCGKVRKNGYWQRRNLHTAPSSTAEITKAILPERGEGSLKHLVADSSIEEDSRNNLLGKFSSCGMVVL